MIFSLESNGSVRPLRRRRRVTNSCGPGAATVALSAALIHVALAGGAWADRHCSPVLFRYYDARTALHEADNACPARLAKALDAMREAAAEARACGCLDVETELETFIGNLPAEDEDCAAAERAILGLDERLADRVPGCN